MSAIAAAPRRTSFTSPAHLTFGRLIRAEWIGLTSLRGTVATLVVGTVLALGASIGLMALILGVDGMGASSLPASSMPYEMAQNAAAVTQIVAVLVGVGIFAKEHSTGALRTHLAAAPRRIAVIGAKAVVVGASAFAWSLVVIALALAGNLAVAGFFGWEVSFDDALRTLVLPIAGLALVTALVGVLSLGVAALLRSETWAVTTVLVFLLVAPTMLLILPYEWAATVSDLLFANSSAVLGETPAVFDGDALRDVAVTLAWPAAALIAGMAAVRRRDA